MYRVFLVSSPASAGYARYLIDTAALGSPSALRREIDASPRSAALSRFSRAPRTYWLLRTTH